MSGSFVVPAKKIQRLNWDQTWLIFCSVALVILPLGAAVGLAPRLFEVIFPGNIRVVLLIAGSGVVWGTGAFLFARALPRLGFALTNAIVNGATTLIASVSPLLVSSARIGRGGEGRFILGLALLLGGITLCGRASVLRDRAGGTPGAAAPSLGASLLGVLLAVLSGVFSAMLNTGFAYGEVLIAQATDAGIGPMPASLAVWVPVLFGGFLVNAIGTGRLISKAGRWGSFPEAGTGDWLRAASLGMLWFGAIFIYGLCAPALGKGGTVYGYAVFGGLAILTSTTWGIIAGEWKKAGRTALAWLWAGVILFLLAFWSLVNKGQA